MTYPITRQFGPNAKGSELTFSDMDENLLYLDSKVTGSDSYVPIYNGSKSLTSSIIYQNNGKIGIGTTSSYSIFNVVGLTTVGYPGVNSDSYIQFWPNIAGGSAYYITDSGSVLRIGTGEKAFGGIDVINVASTNVGIGTDNPQAKFVVSNNGAQGIEFGYSPILTSSYIESFDRTANSPTDMVYYNGPGTSGSHKFYTNGAQRMVINLNGHVGINNTSPEFPLDVLGSSIIRGGDLTISGSYPRLFLTDTDSDSDYSLINDNGGFVVYDDTNTSPRIYITPSGSIGLNKFSPNATLDVNGDTIITGSTNITGSLKVEGPITISSTNVITGSLFMSGSIGYFGVGSTVTQTGSRANGVTINNLCGTIVMASASGSATANSFVVTNNKVNASDVIILSIRAIGVTNLYDMFVTDVKIGSFRIVFRTTGGTAVDTPYINFVVFKGTTS